MPANKPLVTGGHLKRFRFAGEAVVRRSLFAFGDERRLAYSVKASGRGTTPSR